jgi:hypothetical protein
VENQTTNVQDRPRVLETYGAVLADEVVIELVTAASLDRVALLRWNGKNYEIGTHFQVGSTLYYPPYLHATLFGATWFAREPAEYDSPRKLFWKVVDLFSHYLGFPPISLGT